MKSLRPTLPVESRQPFQVPLRRLPAQLIRQRRHILLRLQRRPLPPRHARGQSTPHRHRHNQQPFHMALPTPPRRTSPHILPWGSQNSTLLFSIAYALFRENTGGGAQSSRAPQPVLHAVLHGHGVAKHKPDNSLLASPLACLLHYFLISSS